MKEIIDRDLFSVKNNKLEAKLLKKKWRELKYNVKPKEEEGDEDQFIIKHVPISHKNIRVGQIILGSVLHVYKYHIIVSLPNRMVGYLPVMNLSRSYNNFLNEIAEGNTPSNSLHELENLYSLGHLLVTKVMSVLPYKDGTSKITLSALPEDVNSELTGSLLFKHCVFQCAVQSDEENGYIMETGISSICSAFLSKKYAPENSFGVGSVLLCAVKKVNADVDDTGEVSIKLSADPSYVNKEINLSKGKINVASIFPGNLLSGTVARVTPVGLHLSFGEFSGFVKNENLTSRVQKVENFKIGENVLARVLYITEMLSEIVCSMNEKLCSESALTSELSNLSIDSIYPCKVLDISSEGAYFNLPEDNYGYCPNRYLSNYKREAKIRNIKVSASYKCKVTHIHLIDQIYSVVLQSKKSESGALFHVGQRVSAKIAEHKSHVSLAVIDKIGKISSIPKLHLSDSDISDPEEKYPVGCAIKGRILKYFPGKDPVLTHKTELVSSELPIVTELGEKSVGTVTLGCIVKIYKNNLLVEFFNDCKALVLGKDIPSHLKNDLSTHFQVGSLVKCKVTSYNDTEKRMFASLRTDDPSVENITDSDKIGGDNSITGDKIESESNGQPANTAIKNIVNCKIISVDEQNIYATIEDSNKKGCIPWYHFSDDVTASKSLFRLLNEGDEIKNAVVFATSQSNLILSVKPSIYHYVMMLKNGKLEDTKMLPSVVVQCFEDKIVVAVMEKGKSEHFIQKSDVVSEKINSLSNIGIEKGQTLFLKKRMSDKRVKFYSHLKEVLSNSRTSGLQVLYDTLLQEKMIRKLCSEIKDLKLKDAVIGASYDCKVIQVGKAGALVWVSELGLNGVIHPSQYDDSYVPIINETLKARLINVNYYELCLELTARKDVKKYFCKKKHNIKVQQEAKCDILIAKKKYIIGCLLNVCPGQIIYLPSRRHINDFGGRHSYYETGKEYDIVIEHIDEEQILANLKVHTEEMYLGVSKELPSFTFNSEYHNFIDDIILDETRYTQHDFRMRALAKVERVNNWTETKKGKKKKNAENLNEWTNLKEDKFSQIDKELYWKYIVEKREERKKMKKTKLGPIKAKKRKFSESLDENDLEDVDETNKNETYEDVTADQSNNFITSVEQKTKRDNTKKRKLDVNKKDITAKENYDHRKRKFKESIDKNVSEENDNIVTSEQPERELTRRSKSRKLNLNNQDMTVKEINGHENITEDDSDSEATSEDESLESNTDKMSFLKLESSGFDWSGGQTAETRKEEAESSSSDDEVEDTKKQKSVKKLSKYEKSLKKKTEEKRTRELELERLNEEREPQTALDFEEKIEQNPHSSVVWIEYISFHLENTETEKAKAVASRALATIPPTKEEERLALWNVSLRLEVMYGTDESIQNSFRDALSRNDELKIYNIMIDIYLNANKLKEADKLIKKMVKKYSQNREVWIKAFMYCFKASELTEARNLLDRSILSLPKSDHVEVINKFAQLELKQGDSERGKTIFETLLSSYPKRLDIWNVYADLLMKQNDIEGSRNVLERITGLKLKIKPMRNAFKKLLEFEKKYGTPQRVEAVKAKVEEYVTAALAEEN